MTMQTRKISIILPCYNEKESILVLADAIHRQLAEYDHEIIVVDDNSPDGTYDLVVAADQPYIKSFKRESDASLAKYGDS